MIRSLDFINEDPNKSGLKVGENIIPHSDSTPSDFKYKVDDNSLHIKTQSTNKGMHIKIGTKDNQKYHFLLIQI